MKKVDIILVFVCLVLAGVLAASYAIAGNDELIAAGARLERFETDTVAATGQAAVELEGRKGRIIKVTKIIQEPAASENNEFVLTLETRDGDTYELFSLHDATHSEVQVDDLEEQVYYADGATGVADTSYSPIYIRENETLSLQGDTNATVALVIEYLVLNQR